MAYPKTLELRPIEISDKNQLANLLHFETYVHTHLDWRRPVDWIGREPFFVLDRGGRLEAAIACPPEPRGIAWLRLFAVSSRIAVEESWQLLWEASLKALAGGTEVAISIPIHQWTEDLLINSGFEQTHQIVVLDWMPSYGDPLDNGVAKDVKVREMQTGDLETVRDIDHSSFPPLWRNSQESIQFAFGQASRATVIEKEGQVCAYQISTSSPHGLHLARLAVHPDFQGQRMAYSLVRDLQQRVSNMEGQRLTVNTQSINEPSLSLYNKAGFKQSEDKLPVYELQINS